MRSFFRKYTFTPNQSLQVWWVGCEEIGCEEILRNISMARLICLVKLALSSQGGHGTGKTRNLVLTFSRQGKHREFCFDTGKKFETQGKYFSVTQGKI